MISKKTCGILITIVSAAILILLMIFIPKLKTALEIKKEGPSNVKSTIGTIVSYSTSTDDDGTTYTYRIAYKVNGVSYHTGYKSWILDKSRIGSFTLVYYSVSHPDHASTDPDFYKNDVFTIQLALVLFIGILGYVDYRLIVAYSSAV